MYPDELRNPEELNEMQAAFWGRDIMGLVSKYKGALQRAQKLQREPSAGTHAGLKDLEAKYAQEKQAWANEKKDLLRKLGEAHGALKIYREGYYEQKELISNLRNSRSMKLGRALTSPISGMKSALRRDARLESDSEVAPQKNPAEQAKESSETSSERVIKPSPEQAVVAMPDTTAPAGSKSHEGEKSAATSRAIPISERSAERLEEDFKQSPSPRTLKYLVTRLWYQHGQIEKPSKLIRANAELVSKMQPRDRQLMRQIREAASIQADKIVLPERSKVAAYIVEPNRVMYCVHSTPAYESNGYSVRTRGVANGLKAAGKDVVVVARASYPWDTPVKNGPGIHQRVEKYVDGIPYIHAPGQSFKRHPLTVYLQSAVDVFIREAKRSRPGACQVVCVWGVIIRGRARSGQGKPQTSG